MPSTYSVFKNREGPSHIPNEINSDLIEDKELRRLALLTYINKTVKQNPDSALREYQTADAYVYSEIAHYDHDQKEKTQKAVKLDSSTIILGGKIALVIEKSDSYILGKFDQPTFEDKPYFTIAYHEDSYFGGQYDLDLETATANFIKRNQ